MSAIRHDSSTHQACKEGGLTILLKFPVLDQPGKESILAKFEWIPLIHQLKNQISTNSPLVSLENNSNSRNS